MSTLHLLFHPNGRAACWAAACAGDCVVLLDAAAAIAAEFSSPAADVRCCVIFNGAPTRAALQIDSISYDDLVTLVINAERTVSWD